MGKVECLALLFFSSFVVGTTGTIEKIIRSQSGTITSPDFPNAYPRESDEDYVWRIKVPDGFIIKVTFTVIQMTWEDEVQVFDGWHCHSWAWNHRLRSYKGVHQKNPVDVIFNTKNEMCIELERYKGGKDKKGFSLQFVAIPKCNGKLTGQTGDIISVGYPFYNYARNANCKWSIVVDEGQRILLQIQEFELEQSSSCEKDYLTIKEGNTELLRVCGKQEIKSKSTTENNAEVIFKTNYYTILKGFWIVFRATGCKKSELPTLTNGQHMNPANSYPESFIAKYTCRSGFKLKNDLKEDISRCEHDGKWSALGSECEDVTCKDPGFPGNGHVKFSSNKGQSGYRIGTLALFSCKPLYDLLGDPAVVCLADGTWNATRPKCNVTGVRTCSDPGDPPHGLKVGSNYSTGQTVTFACDPGYILKGATTRTCLSDGKWSGVQPTCSVIRCSNLTAPANGKIDADGLTYGSRALYACDTAYRLSGNVMRTCGKDGLWSGGDPVCNKITCGTPGALDHSTVQFKSTHVGSVANYSCEDGFILDGPHIRTCSNDGQWTGNPPFCARNTTGVVYNTSAPPFSLSITPKFTETAKTTKTSTKSKVEPPKSSTQSDTESSTMIKILTTAEKLPDPDELSHGGEVTGYGTTILAICGGVALLIGIALLCAFLLFRRRRKNRQSARDDSDTDFDNPMYGEMNSTGNGGVSVSHQKGNAHYRVPQESADSGDIYAQSTKSLKASGVENEAYEDHSSNRNSALMLENDLYESRS